MDLIWKDPPPRSGPGKHAAVPAWLEALKAAPGKWAVVEVVKGQHRAGWLKKRYGLETATRRLPDGRYELYARWPTEVTRLKVKAS